MILFVLKKEFVEVHHTSLCSAVLQNLMALFSRNVMCREQNEGCVYDILFPFLFLISICISISATKSETKEAMKAEAEPNRGVVI